MDTWSRIGNTVAQEFSDLPDVESATRIVLRLPLQSQRLKPTP